MAMPTKVAANTGGGSDDAGDYNNNKAINSIFQLLNDVTALISSICMKVKFQCNRKCWRWMQMGFEQKFTLAATFECQKLIYFFPCLYRPGVFLISHADTRLFHILSINLFPYTAEYVLLISPGKRQQRKLYASLCHSSSSVNPFEKVK